MRLFLADLAQARHEIQHGQAEQREPGNKRQHQLGGETAGQGDDGDEVHADARDDLDHCEQHFTHSQCSLHHFGSDPAGKLVGKERQALAQHQPVEVPAQAQRQVDRQHLVLHQRAQANQHDAGDQQQAHAPQNAAFFGAHTTAGLPVGEQVHHLAEEGKQPRFVDRDPGAEQCQRQDVAAGAAGAGPQKTQQADWGRWYFVGREGVEPAFEGTEHGGLRGLLVSNNHTGCRGIA